MSWWHACRWLALCAALALAGSRAAAPGTRAWTARGAAPITLLHRYNVGYASDDAVFLPREHLLVIAQEAGKRALVLDEMTGQVLAAIALPTGARHVAADPALRQVYLPDEFSGRLAIIDYRPGWAAATTTLVRLGLQPHGVAVDPVTHRVYVGNEHGASLSIVDGARRRVVTTVPVGITPGGVGMAPEAGLVYVILVRENRVVVLDRAGRLLRNVLVDKGPTHLAVDAGSTRAAVVNTTAGTLSLIDGASGSASTPLPVGLKPYTVVYDGARSLIAVGSASTPRLTLVDSRGPVVRAAITLDMVPGALALDTTRRLLFVGSANRPLLEVYSYGGLS